MRLLATVAAGIALLGVVPTSAASALTVSAPSTPPGQPASSAAPSRTAPPSTAATWGVAPSTARGPNGRAAFGYKLDPGATLTDYVGVTNHSGRPLTLDLYASDAVTTTRGGFDLLAAGQKPADVGSWVRLPRRTVTIPPTSRLDVLFTLTVPRNATPGDHAGGIVASLTSGGTDAQGNRVAVDHRVGARIYLRVTGELQPTLAVQDLRVRHTGSVNPLTGGTVTATVTVRNTGNVRLAGQPVLGVAGPFGLAPRSVTGAALPEILPGGELTTTVRMPGVPPLFRLTADATVTPVAVGDQVLDPRPRASTARAAVWAVPWPQLALLALLALAGWALIATRRRRAARHARAVAAAREEGRAEAGRAPDADRSGPGHDNRQPAIDRTGKDDT
ncbi:WxL protein peptidoglycan domain-containing protein [Micromonospora aurantiaca (nom. illeg.)]|uniref:WxL protein peptidoglycan domain-containing protein n=1 Tax=Micromonospora aurantiaca (nom. illeg.) TaxID=47850 RepID=UPI0033D5EDD5